MLSTLQGCQLSGVSLQPAFAGADACLQCLCLQLRHPLLLLQARQLRLDLQAKDKVQQHLNMHRSLVSNTPGCHAAHAQLSQQQQLPNSSGQQLLRRTQGAPALLPHHEA
jgi:hypothetical protein